MNKRNVLFLLLIVYGGVTGQTFSGHVYEIFGSREVTLPGAAITDLSGNHSTFSDSSGYFSIQLPDTGIRKVVVSYPGYVSDTLSVKANQPVKVILRKVLSIEEVNISAKRDALKLSTLNPVNVQVITKKELLKAACCNLSEAFETNPSVSVSYKDAVTGVKEIQLLGLGGTYVQLLAENIPDMRGLAGIYGLTFIPGPWIESIQLSKGGGSVVNGYESTTGQINVEFVKPTDMKQPRFFLNLFSDEKGGTELNILTKHKVGGKWSSIVMLHGKRMKNEVDRNNDGFMDVPDNSQVNFYNRWIYQSGNRLESQLGVKFLSDEINGGQTMDVTALPRYQTSVRTRRAEAYGKLGIVFPEKPSKSIGNIVQFTYHDMKSLFGLKSYDASERSLYLQSIYQNIFWRSNHQYRTGITYRYNLLEQEFAGLPQDVEENIPGVFFEYTYSYLDKLSIIAGMREDFHENEWVFTPRLHGKYNFSENLIFRFSGGKSYRRPYLIADNFSVLASARQVEIREDIKAERAWNYGANFTSRFNIADREITLSGDAYRTEFLNQLVVDAYSDSSKITFYNLNGDSYSNSFQLTLDADILEFLNYRISYKIDDVKSTFNGIKEAEPLVAKERILSTVSFSTPNEHWKFDVTWVWEGRKRLQNVFLDDANQRQDFSPSFSVMNFQVTKVFRRFELYSGAENIFDFRQMNPIINPDNPFGNSFDATNIWGPVQGRRIYAGIRYSIK